jgi:Thrombospondin type 3 repeat
MSGRLVAVGLVVVIAFAVGEVSPGPGQATTWNPFFGPPDFYRLDPTTPGANSDVHAQFNITPPPANHTDLFGGRITFGDPDVFVANAAGIPGTGAYVGDVQMVATMGLANEGCNTPVAITFNFVEANVDTTALSVDTPPGDGNPLTSNDPLLVGGGGIPPAADDAMTTFSYIGASGTDPLGVRADGLPINEIRIDSEEMLITAVDTTANTYTVTRGWNGTATAAHAAATEIRKVNVIFPSGPPNNLLADMAEDDGNFDNFGSTEFADFANQIADGADAVPSFVRDSLDPNANPDDGGALQPHARYFAVQYVAATLITVVQYVIMAPGSLSVLPNLSWASSAWGYASVMLWQDPLAAASDSAITDFCNFQSNTVLYGTTHDNSCTGAGAPPACGVAAGPFFLKLALDGGCPGGGSGPPNECGSIRNTNPAVAQAVRYYNYNVSQRDYDNDGHENALDTCPYNPNASWDPREFNALSGGDADGDGLPTACDPNDASADSDEDNDSNPDNTGWFNRLDNCPTVHNTAPVGANPDGGGGTVPNTFQFDRDVAPGQAVPDGGPASDGIGPACDIAGNSCGGCPALTSTGANGHYHAAYATQHICIGAPTAECDSVADADGDGVVNARDTCFEASNPPQTYPVGPANAPTLGVEAAGSTVLDVASAAETVGFTIGSPVVVRTPLETLRYITAIDSTAPGFSITISVGLTAAHAAGASVEQVMFAQSQGDLNADGVSNLSDLTQVAGAFGSEGGNPGNDGVGDGGEPGYQGRLDLTYDSFIDMDDVSLSAGLFGLAC